ncbi:hypothetical protein BKI52_12155 [marine bacterium AO1-C]|nr:hypothetical protein BKI52_12155 [marine bacterium AO1-C]
MTQSPVKVSDQDARLLQTVIDCITPFFQISDHQEDRWVLWLDFLLEVQAKLMTSSEDIWEGDFAFRCSENFQAIRQTLMTLAHHNVDAQRLEVLREKLEPTASK